MIETNWFLKGFMRTQRVIYILYSTKIPVKVYFINILITIIEFDFHIIIEDLEKKKEKSRYLVLIVFLNFNSKNIFHDVFKIK